MNEETQVSHYNKYLEEYEKENHIWNNDEIREDLKRFSMKIKSALKVALEEVKEEYSNENPYMISLSYAYDYADSSFWTIVSTESEYNKNFEEDNDDEEETEEDLLYYKYCPEESCHWELGQEAFDLLNESYTSMVENQEYEDEEEESFWDSDEFDDFYEELEETVLKSIEDLKKEDFLEKLNMKDILFQFYVREYYSEEDDLKMFVRLNNQNQKACEDFAKWL